MFLLVSVRHVGAHLGEHQHGVSIQISISLGKTFLRISRIRNISLTWILARVFIYVPPFISQILDLIYWTVLIFYSDLFWMAWHRKPAITEWKQYIETILTGSTYPSLPSSLAVFAMRFPHYIGAWNRLAHGSRILCMVSRVRSKTIHSLFCITS